jgi:hypothetical protein
VTGSGHAFSIPTVSSIAYLATHDLAIDDWGSNKWRRDDGTFPWGGVAADQRAHERDRNTQVHIIFSPAFLVSFDMGISGRTQIDGDGCV